MLKHRLAIGATSRLPRVNPKESVQYKEWTIPAGVSAFSLGISSFLTRLKVRNRNVLTVHFHVARNIPQP